jgi:hypothetical protein
MTVFDLIKRHYPDYLFRLKKIYPDFFAFLKSIPILPWKDEYNIADRNPELIEAIEELKTLRSEGKISEEEYLKKIKDLSGTYASRTEGIAFINEGFVSFRDKKPSIGVILHEAGHIYFGETDLFWNSTYGGGEVLFWLGLEERYRITEENVRYYMSLLREGYENPQAAAEKILEKLSELNFNCRKSLFCYFLYAGTLPDPRIVASEIGFSSPEEKQKFIEDFNRAMLDLNDSFWNTVPHTRSVVFYFFQDLISGLVHFDPFYTVYAEKIGIVKIKSL